MVQYKSRELLAAVLNRIVSSGRATAAQLVARGVSSNGSIGRLRNAQTDAGIDVLDEVARFLGVEPWQVLHPDPTVHTLSHEAIEAGRHLDKITDPATKRAVYASWMASLHVAMRDVPDDAAGQPGPARMGGIATIRGDLPPTETPHRVR